MEPAFYNPIKAEKYLKIGCDKNHQKCCFNLAVMYKKGEKGIPQSDIKSEEYQEKYISLIKQFGKMQ